MPYWIKDPPIRRLFPSQLRSNLQSGTGNHETFARPLILQKSFPRGRLSWGGLGDLPNLISSFVKYEPNRDN
ncbi:uncharacterized protein DNG_07492 [Cephalotrichum gorgonifer]|uniref:Uncharacterized protein n=1 Tax=Cephalotrichum gorgonifer TaxID=2041049 RepID=A0AAE8N2H3_9PEZI|nr:uncharacterized protein DNG_07492 [Cephalotrichum gorgonifer]